MCGIFAIVNDKTNQVAKHLIEGLRKLEYRGYDSWGIAIKPTNGENLLIEKHTGKIGNAKTSLPKASIGIGHTRWATHGGITDQNAHPHLDCSQKIAVIHNGIVENYLRIKSGLKGKGHRFNSETDTEVIAHLVEEKIKNLPLHLAVFQSFKELVGSNAIAILDQKTEMVIACRNGSPLVVGFGKDQYFLGSDVPAFLKYTNRVYFLADGEAVIISKGGISLFDINSSKKKKVIPTVLDWKLTDAQKAGYPHFLLKEIIEQKNTVSRIAEINEDEIKKLAKMLIKGYKLVLTACGTASYCALAAKYFFAEVGIETQVCPAYEFLPFAKFCNQKTILIAISQSGETADTLDAVETAKRRKAKIVAVLNARGSTLERMADFILPVSAGPEIAVVSTKAFTSQLATMFLLAQAAAVKFEKGQQQLKQAGQTLKQWLNLRTINRIINLAKSLIDRDDIYLIGKYLNYPAALEFALKIKETSYIHAEAFASGELKHGVIALIQKKTPCFVLASNDKAKEEVLSSAAQLKARGGHIIGIAPFEAYEFDFLVKTPDLGQLTIIPNVIVGQLFGYYLGLGRGTDPDKPRNLAKSVTVK